MIANIDHGANLFGVLSYNHLKVEKEKGKILFTNKMIETPDGNYSVQQLARSFEPYLVANNKTEKPVLHISLNPNPQDKVSDEKFRSIAQDYMEQMGYGNQPYVVFKHTDIDRTHIHIVSVCIDEQGRKISDSFEKRRSVNLSRELEIKYGLLPITEKEQQQNKMIFSPVDFTQGNIKYQIASVIRHLPNYYKFQSMGEYNALLSLFNISAEVIKGELHGTERHGLVYFALSKEGDKSSNPLKASLFGKSAGYVSLQKHFEHNKELLKQEPATALVKNLIERAMHTAKDEINFKKQLQQQGINTIVRRNETGRIYGITFVDQTSKTVWNGSRFGKEFSANAFNDWLSHEKKQNFKTGEQSVIVIKQQKTNVNQTSEMPHHLFEFLYGAGNSHQQDESNLLESLADPLLTSPEENYDELLFENQMKKGKKRKKKQ